MAAFNFEKGGMDIRVEGNIFKGSNRDILLDTESESIYIDKSQGARIKVGREFSQVFTNN